MPARSRWNSASKGVRANVVCPGSVRTACLGPPARERPGDPRAACIPHYPARPDGRAPRGRARGAVPRLRRRLGHHRRGAAGRRRAHGRQSALRPGRHRAEHPDGRPSRQIAPQDLRVSHRSCTASTSMSPTASSSCWSARPAAASRPLLRMIAGLEEVTAGELRIGERLANRLAAPGAQHLHGVPELCAVSRT